MVLLLAELAAVAAAACVAGELVPGLVALFLRASMVLAACRKGQAGQQGAADMQRVVEVTDMTSLE